MSVSEKPGPKLSRLIFTRMGQLLTPADGSLAGVVAALRDEGRVASALPEAVSWVDGALQALRDCDGTLALADDEDLAGRILAEYDRRPGRA